MSWSKHIQIIGQGMPLVWFHGFGFDKNIWQALATSLEDHFCSYLVDLPGFGGSPELEWEVFKDALLIDLPEKFNILGWSLGGLYATRLAIEMPNRVSHLINVASSPFFIKQKGWPGVPKSQFGAFCDNLMQDPEKAMQTFIQSYNMGIFPIENTAPAYRLSSLLAGLEALRLWDLRKLLANLQCPAFYIFGSHDSIIPRGLCKVMQKSHSRFRYALIESAGHAPFSSHKSLFIHELKQFLL